MAKKIICMLLVLLMIGSTLIACSKTPPVADSGTDSGTAASGDTQGDAQTGGSGETTAAETLKTSLGDGYVDVDILKKLPQEDYNGKTLGIALPNESEHGYQFAPSKKTGKFEDDVIYEWKKKVQDTFNMTITYKAEWGGEDQYVSVAGGEIFSGNTSYQLFGHYAYRIHEFITQGYFQDWNALGTLTNAEGQKYLDLDAIRWDQTLNKEVTYNGRLLSLTGDLGVSKLQSAMATFVNTNLLEEYCGKSNNDLYDMVDNGTWTFEQFKTLTAQIYKDDSQPGKSYGDVLGYYSNSGNSLDIWFPAFERFTTARDEVKNTISPTFDDATNVSIIGELRNFYYDGKTVMCTHKEYTTAPSEVAKFRNEELGFCTTQFKNVYGQDGFNNMKAFGVVPTPKYNEAQEHYRTKLNDRYTIWGIPTCLATADRQFTAHMTDALCAESSETLYYQYYEILLKNRYSKEKRTADMVDKVMEHTFFDTVVQFGTFLESYPYLPRNLVADRNLDIASTYGELVTNLETKLQQVYACYNK